MAASLPIPNVFGKATYGDRPESEVMPQKKYKGFACNCQAFFP
jgi:hypothetical protein